MAKTSEKVIYPELSYKIVGATFKVFNTCGYGHSEKYYQSAFAKELKQEEVQFKREHRVKVQYAGRTIGNYFLDFTVNHQVVVELKARARLGYIHVKQVMDYLRSTGYKLTPLIYFTRSGVKYRRIVNSYIE